MDDEEPVVLPITEEMDLHPFRPREIRSVAEEYLKEAREKGFTEVRLIHGKGIGVQRDSIRSLLSSLDFVETYFDAPEWNGSWGATVVRFKPPS